MANCGVEIAFAPKELKVAQELSERLGYWTYQGRSRSRPSGLSGGHRSVSESDQRRALMLPQELMQMPPSRLIVLRAGMPPVRGRKIVYWRERVFMRRIGPPPVVAPHLAAGTPSSHRSTASVRRKADAADRRGGAGDDLTLNLILPDLEAAGREPPARGAPEEEVERWVDRFLEASIQKPIEEVTHER